MVDPLMNEYDRIDEQRLLAERFETQIRGK
jgi:hypothetical protein